MIGLPTMLAHFYPKNGNTERVDNLHSYYFEKEIAPLIKKKDSSFISDFNRDWKTIELDKRRNALEKYLNKQEIYLKLAKSLPIEKEDNTDETQNGANLTIANNDINKIIAPNMVKTLNINQLKNQAKTICEFVFTVDETGKLTLELAGDFKKLTDEHKEQIFVNLKLIWPELMLENIVYKAGSIIVEINGLKKEDITEEKLGAMIDSMSALKDFPLVNIKVEKQVSKSETKRKVRAKLATGNKKARESSQGGIDFKGGATPMYGLAGIEPQYYGIAADSKFKVDMAGSIGIKAKYRAVLDLGQELKIDGEAIQDEGIIKIKGEAATPYAKSVLVNKIREIGGVDPKDIDARIEIADKSVYHRHVIKKGESLSVIAQHYYGDATMQSKILEANSEMLKNPNAIKPNQIIIIPNIDESKT